MNGAVKQKRFYKVNELVFLKDVKKEAKIESIDKEKLEVVVLIQDGEIFTRKTVKFMDIDKLHPTNQVEKNKDVVYFAKVVTDSDAKIPSKRDEDAGYDLYACFNEDELMIMPSTTKAIPTGIASAFDKKYYLNCKHERGSTGKYGMSILSGVVDSGYRGEIFIAVNNTGKNPIVISKNYKEVHISESGIICYPYSKAIAQATIELVPCVDVQELSYDKLKEISSVRGVGKYGSSGK